jgi:hypothetical protein
MTRIADIGLVVGGNALAAIDIGGLSFGPGRCDCIRVSVAVERTICGRVYGISSRNVDSDAEGLMPDPASS